MHKYTGEIRDYNNSMDDNWKQIPEKFQEEAEQLKLQNKSGFESKNLRNWINAEKSKTKIIKNTNKSFTTRRK